MRFKICRNNPRHFQIERARVAGILLERVDEFFHRNTRVMHDSHRFRCGLHTRCRDHIGRDFDNAGVTDRANIDDRLAACLQ